MERKRTRSYNRKIVTGLGANLLALLHARGKRCIMNDNELLERLEETKLSKANSKRSKKLSIMRKILIDKYINKMSREEICAELDFISLSTYTVYLQEAKKVLSHL